MDPPVAGTCEQVKPDKRAQRSLVEQFLGLPGGDSAARDEETRKPSEKHRLRRRLEDGPPAAGNDGPRGRGFQPTLVLATLSAAFGSAFQYGYNIAVVNTPHKVLKSFYNETYFERHGTFMDEKMLLLLWSCTVSMFPLGGLLGSLIVGLMVDKCGRKGTLLVNNVFAIIPAILMGVSKVARVFELIIFARVVLGVCAGISYSALPMYLGELAPKNLRGTLGTMTEVFVIVGVFLAQIFSLQALLGNATGWPVLLALTGVPALLQLLSLPFFPESPRYTLMQKRDEDAARRDLRKLRGRADVEDELAEMRLESQAEQAAGRLSVLTLFAFRPLRWQLISIIVLMAGQQLSGINAINYYADVIYAANQVPKLSYLGIICVFAYIAGHSIGPSPVPSVVRTEIFLQSSRPAAFMVDGAVHWLTNFIVGFMFPSIQEAIGAYSFVIFAGICLLTALYIYVVIPETKGQTFVEINRVFAKRNGVEVPEERGETAAASPARAPPSRATAL
ncbi:PREDICTED: solute carrier family 2, facilitated glucose transporter member 7 [Condylura cristata]|uniref:solute carrier family 2, facilitated glucose transporter member 7 n=1 Tax=Condylura cristata TaxID=143302 RepID=UPI0003344F6B|nr:PREDICTED: solute carrier family 2, facilitated glucose transporter member 7 [Condylura cristata]